MDNHNNHHSNGESYSYSLQRPDGSPGGGKAPGKKRRAAGWIALALAMCILSAGLGGAAGYWAGGPWADRNTQPPSETSQVAQTPQDSQTSQVSQTPQDPQATQTPAYSSVAAENGRVPMTPSEIYEACAPAAVAISTERAVRNAFGYTSNRASAGSGFLISADGTVVTNHHVIDGADTIKVLTADGSVYDAVVTGSDATTDLAILSIEAEDMPYLVFGDSDAMRVGDLVAAIGNPLGELANTQTVGTVSGLSREINIDGVPMVMLQTDASVSPGNSGGPLINAFGEVIGIVSAKSVDAGVEGIGFAIPSNSAQSSIADLREYGYIRRPQMGITIDLDYSSYARRYRLPAGVYVSSVEPGSGAEKAGLREGDVITEMGGTAIINESGLQAAKSRYRAGETVGLKYIRDGKEYTTDITFDETGR
ncbi:MAG: trypsin-like peptidase domain-containing protein [Oscillospiraceae bacterium]|nr:trypsin-like peptidase domain-containing protein [Oscillospiraceae bacterium]